MSDDVTAAPDGGQAAPAPDAVPAQGAASGNWFDGFENADLKGYVETKGFKSGEALAESYQNLEKLRGVPADQLVQFPADPSDREAMLPVYAKMGMPESADQYTNVLGDGFDDNVFQSVAAQAHALGLGDGQFQGLQQIMAEQSQMLTEAQETATAEAFDNWKSGNEQGFQNAAKLMADVGMDEAGLEGLLSGDKAAMYDFLAKVGARSGEPNVITGDTPQGEGFGMSPASARQKINELMADSNFMEQYTSANSKVRAPAIERMTKLQEAASRQG